MRTRPPHGRGSPASRLRRLGASALAAAVVGSTALAAVFTAAPAEALTQNGYVFNDPWSVTGANGATQYSPAGIPVHNGGATTIPTATGNIDVTAAFAPTAGRTPGTSGFFGGGGVGSYGGATANFIGAPTNDIPGLLMFTNASAGCGGALNTAAHVNFSGACEVGTLTFTFSEPVTDAVLDLAGLGGQNYREVHSQDFRLHGARGSFGSSRFRLQTAGVTLSAASGGASNLASDGSTISIPDLRTNEYCHEAPQTAAGTGYRSPTKARAGCGSVVMEGTYTSVTFAVDSVVRPFSTYPTAQYDTGPWYFESDDLGADGINGLNVVSTENNRLDSSSSATVDGFTMALRLPETGAIGDRVWQDDDADGLQDEGEPGVAGVTVELLDGDGNPVTDADGNPITAVTDAEGAYSFPNLLLGDYQVRFSGYPDGFVPTAPDAGDEMLDSDADPATGTTEVRSLTQEAPVHDDVDAGLVPAAAGAPVAEPDTATTPQDTPVTIPLLGNDTPGDAPIDPTLTTLLDPDGNPVDTSTVPDVGTFTVDDEGNVVFDPEPDFTGDTPAVPYRITDGNGLTADSTVTVTVEAGETGLCMPEGAGPVTTIVFNPPTYPAGGPADAVFPNAGVQGGVTFDVVATAVSGRNVDPEGHNFVSIDGRLGVFLWDPNDIANPGPGGNLSYNLTFYEAGTYGTDNPVAIAVDAEFFVGDFDFNNADNHERFRIDAAASVGVSSPTDMVFIGGNDHFVRSSDGDPSQGTDPRNGVLIGVSGASYDFDYVRLGSQGFQTQMDGDSDVFDGRTVNCFQGDPQPPVAAPDTATTQQDTPVTVPLLGNDTLGTAPIDPTLTTLLDDGGNPVDELVVPGVGTFTVDDEGNVVFDPEPDFTGDTPAVPYRITDGNGLTADSTVTVTVEPGVPPTAEPDTATTSQNTPVTVPLLGNDTPGDAPIDPTLTTLLDPDGNAVDELVVPDVGTFTVDDEGNVVFTPEPDFTGDTPAVPYRVTDENGLTADSTVSVTVVPSDPPVAEPDTATTPQNTPVTVPLLGNDTPGDAPIDPTLTTLLDPDGNPVDELVVPDVGTFTVDDEGNVVFTPEPDFTGDTPAVPYRITDENGLTADSTVTVTVTPLAPPVAEPDTATTPENTAVTVPLLGNDTPGDAPIDPTLTTLLDDEGNPVDLLTVPGVGVYTVDDEGNVVFAPETGFTGETPAVPYRITDENGLTADSTVTITVVPNDPPVAVPDTATTQQNTPVTVPLLDNDTPGDAPIDPTLTTLLDDEGNPVDTVTIPGVGTFTVDDEGNVEFVPEPGFTGDTPAVPYRITDENGETADSTVTVTVTPGAPPVAEPDTATTPENTPVTVPLLDNDTPGDAPLVPSETTLLDDEGNPVDELVVPEVGTFTVDDEGNVEFVPEPGFTGDTPAVPYRVTDENGETADSTVTVTVTPADPPTAEPDMAETTQNTPVTLPLLDNDTPGDAPIDPTLTTLLDDEGNPVDELVVPDVGTFTVDDEGNVEFVPEPGFTGDTPAVPYRITDENSETADSTVTVTVTPADPPTAEPDTAETTQNTPVTVPLLDNDTPGDAPLVPSETTLLDDEGNPVDELVVPDVGTFTVDDEGNVEFVPEPGFTGDTPAVPYRVTDENGLTSESTVTVTVTPGAPPVAEPDSAITQPDTPVTIPLLDNDTPGDAPIVPSETTLLDDEGNPVDELVVPGVGTFTVDDEGNVEFVPEPGFEGETPAVPYRITDENGNTAESTVTVGVTPPLGEEPTEPEAADDEVTTPKDTPVTFDPLENDTPGDVPLDPTTVKLIDPDTGDPVTELELDEGTFTVDTETGEVTFTPADGFTGQVPPVDYTVADEDGNEVTATITVTVQDTPGGGEPTTEEPTTAGPGTKLGAKPAGGLTTTDGSAYFWGLALMAGGVLVVAIGAGTLFLVRRRFN